MAPQGRIYWLFVTSRAFLKRDLLFETSYKAQSSVKLLGVFLQIVIFYFLARMVGGEASTEHLGSYGGDYFTFVLVGIAFRDMFDAGLLTHFTDSLRQQLTVGVFEAMCATPIRPAKLMFFSLLWPVATSSTKAFLYLFLGQLLLGARLEWTRMPLLIVALVLSVLVFGSIGTIAGSTILYFKRGDPVTWLLSAATALVGGVFFPITMLPSWLQGLSHAIPLTHSLDAIRAALLPDADLSGVDRDLVALSGFAALLLPTAWLVTAKLFEISRRQGGLGQY